MSSEYRFLRFFAGVGCVTYCVTCAQERKGGQTPSLLLSAVPRNNRSRVNSLSVFMHSQMQMRARAVARRAHRADAAGPRASRQKDRALRKMCSLRTYPSRRRDVSEIKDSPPRETCNSVKSRWTNLHEKQTFYAHYAQFTSICFVYSAYKLQFLWSKRRIIRRF